MSSNRAFSRTAVVVRAATAVAVLLGLTGVVVAAGVRPVLGSAPAAPEAPLLALVSMSAAGCLLTLAVVVLRTAVGIVRAGGPSGRVTPASTRLQRIVAGLLLGAGGLAPQLASAATVPPAATAVSATEVGLPTESALPARADAGPVDPTYLGPSTPAPPRTAAHPSTSPTPAGRSITVHPGDTLWSIVERELTAALPRGTRVDDARVARAVHSLYAANREAVGQDPDLITPGTTLVLPAKETLR